MKFSSKSSDEKLMQALLSEGGASLSAFECIFHKYYPMILNFVKGMLKDATMAEDVAQNIFMKLWINRHKLNPKQSLKNYLCVIARHDVINILSSKFTKSTVLEAEFQEDICNNPSVEEWISYAETNLTLQKDIEAMPPQRRTIFKMSRYEHMSNVDIALKMNLSVRTVEKHIELALKDLRKTIN